MVQKKTFSYINSNDKIFHQEKHSLDVFYNPGKSGQPVIVFFHGGSWMEGDKDIYNPLGRNFTDMGYVCCIANYRLYPLAQPHQMVEDCTNAIKWIRENIESYGGKKDMIILSGHSAGGHLSAMIGLTQPQEDPMVKGVVLVDAFGLNIGDFLKMHSSEPTHFLFNVFGKEEELWQKVTPSWLITAKCKTPFLIFIASDTYHFIHLDNNIFIERLKAAGIKFKKREIKNVTHSGIMIKMEDRNFEVYAVIRDFIDQLTE